MTKNDKDFENKKVWNRRSKKNLEEVKNTSELLVFSKNLKHYRDSKCLSYFKLEAISGVSVNVLYEIENLKGFPSFLTITKIAKAFDIHPAILFLEHDLFKIEIEHINRINKSNSV